MSIRRVGCLVIAVFILAIKAAALDPPVPEQLYGAQALLYCVESGQALFEKDADTPVPPASLTKLMTALVVLEHVNDLSVQTTVSQTAVQVAPDAVRIGLIPGEVVTLRDMMYAMLLHTADDAANVLAESVGKTQQGFAAMMNERAAALGATGSHFTNAYGMDAEGQTVTARDVARITQALLQDPRFVEITGALSYTMQPTDQRPTPRTVYTKQHMLVKSSIFYNPSAIAGQSGYSSRAQHTQMMAARKDGLTWIAVSLGASGDMYDPFRDMRTLFDLAMQQFHAVTLTEAQVAQTAARALGARVKEQTCAPLTLAVPLDADTDKISFVRNWDNTYSVVVHYEGQELPVGQIAQKWETVPVEMPKAAAPQKEIARFALPTVRRDLNALRPYLPVPAIGIALFALLGWWVRVQRNRRENQQYDYVLGMRTHKKQNKRKKKEICKDPGGD